MPARCKGEAVNEAFYVRCDAEINAVATREAGQVITEIGLAPTRPAEFIVVSVQHRAGNDVPRSSSHEQGQIWGIHLVQVSRRRREWQPE